MSYPHLPDPDEDAILAARGWAIDPEPDLDSELISIFSTPAADPAPNTASSTPVDPAPSTTNASSTPGWGDDDLEWQAFWGSADAGGVPDEPLLLSIGRGGVGADIVLGREAGKTTVVRTDPGRLGVWQITSKTAKDGSLHDVETELTSWIAWRSAETSFLCDGTETAPPTYEVTVAVRGGGTRVIQDVPDTESVSATKVSVLARLPLRLPTTPASVSELNNMLRVLDAEHLDRRTIYTRCGWERLDNHWTCVAPGGSVDATGRRAGVTVGGGKSSWATIGWGRVPERDELPALMPMLGELLETQSEPLPTVAVSMLGVVAASLLRQRRRPGMLLVGEKGSGKSLAASYLQTAILTPDAGAPSGSGFALSLAGATSTAGALAAARWMGDLPLIADDYKAAAGARTVGVDRPEQVIDALARAAYGEGGEAKATVTGGLQDREPPRCALIVTGERVPSGSTVERLAIVSVSKGVSYPEIISGNGPLDAWRERWADAGWLNPLYGSYVSWLAAELDRCGMDAFIRRWRDVYARRFSALRNARAGEAVAFIALGWDALRAWAEAMGVAHLMPTTARVDLTIQAILASSSGAHQHTQPGVLLVAELRDALAGSSAHLTAQSGDAPRNDLRRACNWRPDGADWRPVGRRIGFVDGDEVVLIAREVMSLIGHHLALGALTQAQIGEAIIAAGGSTGLRRVYDGRRSSTNLWALPASELGIDTQPSPRQPPRTPEEQAEF